VNRGTVASGHRIAEGYRPHIHQQRFHASRARFRLLVAGRRGGKTIAGAAEFLQRIYATIAADVAANKVDAHGPDGPGIFDRPARRNYWVVAPDYRLVEAARRYVFQFLPSGEWKKIGAGRVAGWHRSDRTLWLDPDVSVSFRTAEDPQRLVSESLDGLWLTEAARLKPEAWPVLSPGLADREGWLIADTTPLGQNWFYEQLWMRAQADSGTRADGYEGFHWHTEDNPAVPLSEIERAKRETPQRYFEREYRASFHAFHGRIYDEFTEATHVYRGPAPLGGSFRRVVCGVDYGMVSPTAFVVLGIGADDRRQVIHEQYASGRSLSWCVATARAIKATYGVAMFWVDPSAAGLLMELRNNGCPAQSADNDVLRGIQSVATHVHATTLTVHASCANLIRELLSYRWKEHRQHGTMEEPADNQSDHAADALRYAVVSESTPDPYRGALR
jgi:phage terminase large subunit